MKRSSEEIPTFPVEAGAQEVTLEMVKAAEAEADLPSVGGLRHGAWEAEYRFDHQASVYRGEVLGLKAPRVTFVAERWEDLQGAFEEALAKYEDRSEGSGER